MCVLSINTAPVSYAAHTTPDVLQWGVTGGGCLTIQSQVLIAVLSRWRIEDTKFLQL